MTLIIKRLEKFWATSSEEIHDLLESMTKAQSDPFAKALIGSDDA